MFYVLFLAAPPCASTHLANQVMHILQRDFGVGREIGWSSATIRLSPTLPLYARWVVHYSFHIMLHNCFAHPPCIPSILSCTQAYIVLIELQ